MMSAVAADTPSDRTMQRIIDLAERVFFVLLYATFFAPFAASVERQPYNVVALAAETILCAFVVLRPFTGVMTLQAGDWLLALSATAFPLLVRPGGDPLAPTWVVGLVMSAGVLFSVWAKLTLRMRFGIAAANRGVVMRGPYRLVRHPIYAGYFVTHTGILLANPTAFNAVVLCSAAILQVLRVHAEERFLAADPDYRQMMATVRYRVIPGVY
jgi:protein-S-isoprenylcysteine O-methyltransferase Ste14